MIKNILLGTATAVALLAAQQASSQELSWSFSATGAGRCTSLADSCAGGATGVVYTPGSQTFNYDFAHNASSTGADPSWGIAHGSAGPGDGFLAAPQLRADSAGVPFHDGAFSWVYSQVQGVQSYTWTGAAVDLALSAFVGTLDFDVSGGGYGQATASFAILDHTVGEDRAIGDSWYKQAVGSYAFANGCDSPGAIAVAESGVISGPGPHSATLAPSCGESTFHLETGETFYLWARLSAFHANNGLTDASHTFKIGLSPDAAPELVMALQENLERGSPLDLGRSVPEPSVWALLVGGFGLAGAALRRRRAGAA